MNAYQFQIQQVRKAPPGFKDNVVGLVTFAFTPTAFDGPIVVTRWQKGNDEREGKAWPNVTIMGARVVTVHDAQIVQYKDNFFVSANNVELPRPLSDQVAQAAIAQLRGQAANTPGNTIAVGATQGRAAPAVANGDGQDSYGVGSAAFQGPRA